MIRILFVLLAVTVVLPAQVLVQGTELRIDVVAVDRQGAPVTDLKQEEVEVWIGGRRIPIESFALVTPTAGERAQRAITLLIDDITLTPVGLARAKDIAHRFVGRTSAGDQVMVIRLSGGAARSADDPATVARQIDAISLPAGGFLRREDLSAHVLTTLTSIARQVGESETRRKVIVAIGAGFLFDTPIPPPTATIGDLRREWTDAVRAMASANATLYVIDPGGVGVSPWPSSGGHGFARDLGGHAFINTNDEQGAVGQILRDTTTYYAITVADPPVFKKAEVRELDVRVLRRGVAVRAKRFLAGR